MNLPMQLVTGASLTIITLIVLYLLASNIKNKGSIFLIGAPVYIVGIVLLAIFVGDLGLRLSSNIVKNIFFFASIEVLIVLFSSALGVTLGTRKKENFAASLTIFSVLIVILNFGVFFASKGIVA